MTTEYQHTELDPTIHDIWLGKNRHIGLVLNPDSINIHYDQLDEQGNIVDRRSEKIEWPFYTTPQTRSRPRREVTRADIYSSAQLVQLIGHGIDRDKLYYWERMGYINPAYSPSTGRRQYRRYSINDALKATLMWRHVNEGHTIELASNLVEDEISRMQSKGRDLVEEFRKLTS